MEKDEIITALHYITLKNYLQWPKYGDAVIKQCLGKIAEINEF